MHLLGPVYLLAGGMLSFSVLRFCDGNFEGWQGLAIFTAVPNALTLLIAYLLFRSQDSDETQSDLDRVPYKTSPASVVDRTGERIIFLVCYAVGFGSGVYFYLT